MACRTLLLKLERRGQIRLPVRQGSSPNARRNSQPLDLPCDRTPIEGALSDLHPVKIEALGEGHPDQRVWRFLLQRHHYLGLRNSVGENLKYLARDRRGRPLACLLFGAAAWKAQARDEWIGWDAAQRRHGLPRLANNARFLVLPWVRVPHLASHLLGGVVRRIDTDWRVKYGHGIELLETFVDRRAFGEPAIGPRVGSMWAPRPAAAATTAIRRSRCPSRTSICGPCTRTFAGGCAHRPAPRS
jgi:hypothetical protein